MFKRLWNTKTFKLAVGTILAAVGAYLLGEQSLQSTIMEIVGVLMGLFIRDGVAKLAIPSKLRQARPKPRPKPKAGGEI